MFFKIKIKTKTELKADIMLNTYKIYIKLLKLYLAHMKIIQFINIMKTSKIYIIISNKKRLGKNYLKLEI